MAICEFSLPHASFASSTQTDLTNQLQCTNLGSGSHSLHSFIVVVASPFIKRMHLNEHSMLHVNHSQHSISPCSGIDQLEHVCSKHDICAQLEKCRKDKWWKTCTFCFSVVIV